ncbi:adenine phosphoribosyltransferase [uncultured Roseobacter sp.]|uniref:adenine phosphoribosyltransferase n=1 Tax=uncultured Roseobacter sp. TaxID=114847 RepID=UPI00261D6E8E|nr:adenine phosphoribosyltransferase [uncultured Roseobacter sp.]
MNKKSSRLQELTRYVDRHKQGIEIAPFFNPAVPKSDGYNVLVLDISTTAELRERAKTSDHIPNERIDEIEDVDIVGDASSLADLLKAAQIDDDIHYIVSSHNFEHLPNPIKFLQGCADVLPEGGIVSMAIPDYRACFDHFRFPTRLSDWMRAYRQDIDAPDPDTIFDYVLNKSTYQDSEGQHNSCSLQLSDPGLFVVDRRMGKAFDLYSEQLQPDPVYVDVHCTVSFGATFELMVRDLAQLGLLDLEVIDVTETHAHEYFVHLRKTSTAGVAEDEYYQRRDALMKQIDRGLGPLAFDQVRSGRTPGYFERSKARGTLRQQIGAMLLGEDRLARLRERNRQRRTRRRLSRN